MGAPIQLYDTTLRDGSQSEGISLTVEDKLKITRLLDELGMGYVEGGWPGSNPKDVEYFQRVKALGLTNARVAAFGSTCRADTRAEDDPNLIALLDAETPVITLVGKSWTLHVRDVLRTTPDENLRMIRDSVRFAKAAGREVVFDAEHFFDGYRADPAYAEATATSAAQAGADTVVLADTNGGATPWEIEEACLAMQSALGSARLGIHTHNDGGLAVANTLAAVRAGAQHVQGTVNGYGERCGNADLCTIIPALELKMARQALPPGRLEHLTPAAQSIASIANRSLFRQAPYVGQSAFAHKGGIHAAAMRRNAASYQHIDPQLVGNLSRIVVSELAGRGSLRSKADEMGIALQGGDSLSEVLDTIKRLEHQGFTFEGAEGSVEMLLRRSQPSYSPPFEMLDFMVVVEHRAGRGIFAEATVKVRVDDQIWHTAAEGNGPVNALDAALRKALIQSYPRLADFRLVDYKVHIIDSGSGTEAITRVLIDTQNRGRRWSTVGASPNIIEASWLALADAVEYGLTVSG